MVLFFRLFLSAMCLGSLVACGTPYTSDVSAPRAESETTISNPEAATHGTEPIADLFHKPQAEADVILGEPTRFRKVDEQLSTATYSGDRLASRFPDDKVEDVILTFFDSKLMAMNLSLNDDARSLGIAPNTAPLSPQKEKAALDQSLKLLQAFSPEPVIEPKFLRESDFIANFGTSKTYCLNKEVSTDVGPGHLNTINLVLNLECGFL